MSYVSGAMPLHKLIHRFTSIPTTRAALSAAAFALASLAASAQTLNWTLRNTGVASGLQYTSAAYGAGKHVVLAYGSNPSGGFLTQAAVSANGTDWSVNTLPTNPVSRGIAFGGGLFVAVAERNGADSGHTQNILTSPDGANWTARTTGSGTLNAIAYAGGRFVAVGAANNGQNAVTSTDGVSWTRVSVPSGTVALNGVVAHPILGNFVAWSGQSGDFYVSSNGSSWTKISLVSGGFYNIWGVTYAGGTYIAAVKVLPGDTSGRLYTSPDGTTWTQGPAVAMPAGFAGAGVAANAGLAGGSATVAIIGGVMDFDTFTNKPYVLVGTGALSSWGAATFGTGDFVDNRFVAYSNGLWILGNNRTQLYIAGDTTGGSGGTGGSGNTGGGTGGSGGTGNTGGGTGGTGGTGGSGGSGTGSSAGAYLSNLSIRARAGTGAETLIVGFTIGGSGTSGTKTVLGRAIGPGLASFGLAGTLADPVLQAYSGTSLIGANDNWSGSDVANTAASLGAFALTTGSRDAALLSGALAPGAYTVQISGNGGTSGLALAELYDTTANTAFTSTTPRLANVSSRTFVGTGDATLICGFVVSGSGQRRVLIRAVGPGLAAWNLSNLLADPQLALYSGASKIAENDNWDASTQPAQQSVYAFALTPGSKDAALVATLNPGAYSVQLSGANGTTGVALIELYELP